MANLPKAEEYELPASVVANGERYTLLAGTCHDCECTFFYPSHPEFIPRHCPYCGTQFRYYHDGARDDFRDLSGRPLG